MTIWEARNLGVKQLQHSQATSKGRIIFSTPSLDCDCLLSHVLGESRSFLLAHNQDFLDNDEERAFWNLLEKRSVGTPIAYLTGKKEFFGFDFYVNDAVLIPKADTELLVEKAIDGIKAYFEHCHGSFRLADICTGSGCVALSVLKTLAVHNYNLELIACDCVDISMESLEVARRNAHSLLSVEGKKSIQFFEGNLCAPLGRFENYDMIVSNPPYVPSTIVDELLEDGRGEPRLALDGDVDDEESKDGLSIIKRLIPEVWECLRSGGVFLIETGEYNATETLDFMKAAGFVDCTTFEDLSGQPRVSYGRKA